MTVHLHSYELVPMPSPVMGYFLSHVGHRSMSARNGPHTRLEASVLQVQVEGGHNWMFLEERGETSEGALALCPHPPSEKGLGRGRIEPC